MSEAVDQLEPRESDHGSGNGDKVPELRRWYLPLALMALTFLSTLYVGANMSEGDMTSPLDMLRGWTFAVPLMAILLAHEFGHFLVGRYHKVNVSPPYFIPMPMLFLGTLGAVIRMPPIRARNALLDVGAAGPLAGMVVALPVLVIGLLQSPIQRLDPAAHYIIEGHSILYVGLIYLLKGPIREGYDVMLSPTALAGWAGLLVTMINLIPVAQLDGGHVAYALFGPRQDVYSERIRRALPWLGLAISAAYGGAAYLRGARGEALAYELMAGIQWIVWWGLLWLMTRLAGRKHPPTGPAPLSPSRRRVAIFTLALFVLLFMPSWIRQT